MARAWERQFLGFSFSPGGKKTKRRIAAKAVAKFKQRVRELTRRSRGVSIERVVAEVTRFRQGWIGYYGYSQQPSVLQDLESWVKRRLRCFAWVQWKTKRRRYKELRRLGVGAFAAARTAASALGPWRLSRTPALSLRTVKCLLQQAWITIISVADESLTSRTAVYVIRMHGGVGGRD